MAKEWILNSAMNRFQLNFKRNEITRLEKQPSAQQAIATMPPDVGTGCYGYSLATIEADKKTPNIFIYQNFLLILYFYMF